MLLDAEPAKAVQSTDGAASDKGRDRARANEASYSATGGEEREDESRGVVALTRSSALYILGSLMEDADSVP